MPNVIQPNQAYTFADYFTLNYDTEDVLSYRILKGSGTG